MSRWFVIFVLLLVGAPWVWALEPLDDAELSDVSGGDGLAAIIDLHLNVRQIAWGTKNVDGATTPTTYLVFDNVGGGLLLPLSIDIEDGGTGSDYFSIKFPVTITFDHWTFGEMSVRTDPNVAPACGATCGLGSFGINGTMDIAGELRVWAH